MATTTTRFSAPTDATDLTRQTTLGILAAAVSVLVLRVAVDLGGLAVGAGGTNDPFAVIPLLASTVVAGAGAAIAYAVLDRVTDRPARTFTALAVAVFTLMLVPVVMFAPTLGVTPLGQAVLAVFHAVVAVPIIAFVTGTLRL
ncbi:DUF6069 family protein [Haloglomus salinum]|jgi:peptidoglycan/LPS O-acetylase OafA/YrhL|uniref:DUF6069 family protein n=1 Tax=Haloglomus salinum TaxID=2962673 RepID=UPI0020C96F4A|nr:DUF6069 family protein [Haloglomus salinum]